jgi:hypothetical protein
MSNLKTCPRCGDRKLEVLRTHSHCLECNYSPDVDGTFRFSSEHKKIRTISPLSQTENILNDLEKYNEQ